MGEFKLGQRLWEVDLGREFHVSNSVVREALHILEGEGIVVSSPYRGRFVFKFGEAEARDLVVVRASLESLAAFLAAEKVEDEQAKRIAGIATTMRTTKAANYSEWLGLELAFHGAIWEATRLDSLCKQLSQLALRFFSVNTAQYFWGNVNAEEAIEASWAWEQTNHSQSHQRIAQSILARNPECARKNMILHIMGRDSLVERRKQVFGI